MNRKIYGIVWILIAVIEFILCFYGPLALQKKPSLFLFPIKSYGLKDNEIEDITAFVEQSFANSRSYAIVSQFVVIEYIKGKGLDLDIPGPDSDLHEYQKIAEILEFDRYVTCFALKHSEGIRLTIRIRNTKLPEVEIPSLLITSTDVHSLLNNSDGKGNDLDIVKQIKVTTKGISFSDFLYFIILIAQAVTAILMIIGFDIKNLPEIIWVFALILFLFAYIYALNANMDYMQRFIASSGRIGLAENTFLEQLFAVIRFGPLLIINGLYYVWKRRRKKDDPDRIALTQSNIVVRVSSFLKASVKKWGLPYALLSAVLFGFSFPSVLSLKGFFFLAWISLIPLFFVFIYCKYSWAVFYGVTFGTIQSFIINYWHGTFGYLSLHFTTVIHILYFITFMIPLVFIVKKSKKWGFILVPVVWTVFDFLRSTGFLGYPWGLIGSSQYQFIPLIQTAAVTGIWGVSFIVILFNSSIAWSLAGLNENWSFFNKETGDKGIKGLIKQYFPVFLFLCVFLISIAGGSIHSILSIIKMNNNEYKQVKLVLIQQNTDPRKHDYRLSLKNLRTLTDTALKEIDGKPDMVVWSEGAFSPDTRYYGAKERSNFENVGLVYEFFDYQKTIGTWLLTGNDDHRIIEEKGKRKRQNFNSSVLFSPEGMRTETYHKMHLVPFTEYFPWKEELPEMYELLQDFNISDWTKGEERIIFEHPKFSFITPICFEDVFSDDIRLFIRKGVDIIVNISNDYWSLTPVEGTQHGIIALFRAVENQRPMVRSTSSGYTVHIDSLGRIREGAPEPYTEDYCIADVFLPDRNLTLYTIFGDWFPVLCIIITIGAFIVILIPVFKRK
ncbi:MAG: apolipoprotein N-acyltransferase [Spirochaetales bacterium]|nr:apolipoprotein N-acyltransferase [Spirochaetales bacterium]